MRLHIITYKYFILSLTFLIISSCSDSILQSLRKSLSEANKAKIYFNKKGTDEAKTITIDNVQDVQSIIYSITDEDAEFYKCDYTGSIEFFDRNKSLSNMEFNLEPDCLHIRFQHQDIMFAKKISEEGIKLLTKYYYKTHNK